MPTPPGARDLGQVLSSSLGRVIQQTSAAKPAASHDPEAASATTAAPTAVGLTTSNLTSMGVV